MCVCARAAPSLAPTNATGGRGEETDLLVGGAATVAVLVLGAVLITVVRFVRRRRDLTTNPEVPYQRAT